MDKRPGLAILVASAKKKPEGDKYTPPSAVPSSDPSGELPSDEDTQAATEQIGKELATALRSNDYAGVYEAVEAIVHRCYPKGE